MINWRKLLTELRHKPYETRVRILWMSTAVLGILLLAVWVGDIKRSIKKLDKKDLVPEIKKEQTLEKKFIRVERVESTERNFKIYFSVKNDTTDILNFSTVEEIELETSQSELKPGQLTDRQNKIFVQKILSNTENFGILVFPKITANEGTLTFNDLYFEKTPQIIFEETIKLDFEELNKNQPLRE